MKATIDISMDNAAFEENGGAELARILRKYANYVKDYATLNDVDCNHDLVDINGNKVGTVKITK